MKSMWAMFGVAVAAAALAGPAAAGSYGAPRVIPGIGEGSSVDVYVDNPDAQPPVAWSQGTAPPPPQGDYGGGFLQYLITGTEQRPARPRVYRRPAAYAPQPGQAYGQPGQAYGQPGQAYGQPGQAYGQPGQAYGQGAVAYAAPAAEAQVQAAIDPAYRRQEVAYAGPQGPGTIVIDTTSKFLYLVEGGGHALRYGIGVGRPGFLWGGVKTITRKAEWPDWTPPGEMLLRRPDLPRHMEGGMANPLGARAMYLGSSLYRIHGTNEPNTIGTNVSSGCIRLLNEDVADLYGRVRVGTKVIVM